MNNVNQATTIDNEIYELSDMEIMNISGGGDCEVRCFNQYINTPNYQKNIEICIRVTC